MISTHDRRAAQRKRAAAIGVTPAYISVLVETFYGYIREDPKLGPIFHTATDGNWEPHLDTMKRFWRSVALSSGEYSGQPVPAHRKHTQIGTKHFEIWIALFRQTLEETAPTRAAVGFFMERAERISTSLQLAIFGVPGLGGPL